MGQQVTVLAANLESLTSIPETHMVERENKLPEATSDLHKHPEPSVTYMHTCTQINLKNNLINIIFECKQVLIKNLANTIYKSPFKNHSHILVRITPRKGPNLNKYHINALKRKNFMFNSIAKKLLVILSFFTQV